ncbi:MAG: phage baseplate assembly protein V [Betaproteobacteria bacterium]|nr:phage baseplate assembly protein V [Betaproteobacteria bacterium]
MNDAMTEEIDHLSEWVDERWYGKYRARVVDNNDPEKRGRLRLHIPAVFGDGKKNKDEKKDDQNKTKIDSKIESDSSIDNLITGWALPCFPFGGGKSYGWFAVPEKDALVWAEFEEGDINRPVWTGVFWLREADVPSDAAKAPPTTRLFQTPSGHIMQFDDKEKKIIIEDANGNKIEMDSSGVTIKAKQVALGGDGGEAVIMGDSFMTMFNTHTHTSAAPTSPTSPPIMGMTSAQLSTKVKTT